MKIVIGCIWGALFGFGHVFSNTKAFWNEVFILMPTSSIRTIEMVV